MDSVKPRQAGMGCVREAADKTSKHHPSMVSASVPASMSLKVDNNLGAK